MSGSLANRQHRKRSTHQQLARDRSETAGGRTVVAALSDDDERRLVMLGVADDLPRWVAGEDVKMIPIGGGGNVRRMRR